MSRRCSLPELARLVAREQRPGVRLPNGLRAYVVALPTTSRLISEHYAERKIEPHGDSAYETTTPVRSARTRATCPRAT